MLQFRSLVPALTLILGTLVFSAPAAYAETQDQTVARLIAQEHQKDQTFIGRTLLQSAGECNDAKDAASCTIDRLIVHGARHGFGLAVRDAQKPGQVLTINDTNVQAAWAKAVQLPVNQPILARQMTEDDQKALDKACPTHEIGCWGPRVLDFGLDDGIRLYLNAAKAHAFDHLRP